MDVPSILDDLERVLVSEKEIADRIRELGQSINELYDGRELIVIAVINGALVFTADLIRAIRIPLQLDCVRVSTYRNATRPQGQPRILDAFRLDIEGRDVLLIDDILDTGVTMSHVIDEIRRRNPASLRTCILLDKRARRTVNIRPDLYGFQIPDEFVVGYGLDFAERYRHLPCIGVLRPELQNPPEWT